MLTAWFDADRHFAAMDEFRRQVDELFHDLDTGRHTNGSRSAIIPRAGLYDTGDGLVLQLELPGVAIEDLTLSGCQDSLLVEGKRNIEAPQGYSVHRQERRPYSFSRTFSFPVKVDTSQAEAELKNGILTVKLPKLPELQPKSIKVKTA